MQNLGEQRRIVKSPRAQHLMKIPSWLVSNHGSSARWSRIGGVLNPRFLPTPERRSTIAPQSAKKPPGSQALTREQKDTFLHTGNFFRTWDAIAPLQPSAAHRSVALTSFYFERNSSSRGSFGSTSFDFLSLRSASCFSFCDRRAPAALLA